MSPEQAHATYATALAVVRELGPMTPAEEAIPAAEWPSPPITGEGADSLLAALDAGHMPAPTVEAATDRLMFMVEHLPDEEPDPEPTQELDAVAALMKDLTFAVLSLDELHHEMELRHDDGQPPADLHRRGVNAALHTLRGDIARCAYHFAEPGDPQ